MKQLNEVKQERITIRLTKKERRALQRRAKRQDMGLSEYLRYVLSQSDGVCNLEVTVLCQELVNYLAKNYGQDDMVRRLMGEIWEKL